MPKGLVLTLGLLLAAVGLFGVLSKNPASTPAPESSAVSSGPCLDSGVTLVIDFGSESALESKVSCLQDFAGNGWQLLEEADLAPTGTSQYPAAFVCRIGGWPTETAQDCLDTPSYQEGTWVYFKSLAGEWVRSGQGAADPNNRVACGAAEGWVFITPNTPKSEQSPSASVPELTCDTK